MKPDLHMQYLSKPRVPKHLIFPAVITLLIALATALSGGNLARAGTQATFYVAPNGSDANPGTLSQPFHSLARAKAVVRTVNTNMTGDIIVYLRGGTYVFTNTLTFGPADSGSSGYRVIYSAYPSETPVISGGKTVTGWTLHDASNNIWQASVGAADNFRQIYVNGLKATRARSSGPPAGCVQTATGFSTTDLTLQNYGNITNLELVTHPKNWIQDRLPVAAITGTNITIQQPCWGVLSNTTNYVTSTFGLSNNLGMHDGDWGNVVWLENAYEFMNTPGFWYLNLSTHTLYYIPRPWENLTNATVEIPVVEQLIAIAGTATNPVSNLEFSGLTFRLSNWLQPSTGYGLPYDQANQLDNQPGDDWGVKAAVDCTGASNVWFSSCTFHQLGGDGINFLTASHQDTVTDCFFYDIAASAVQVGRGVFTEAALPLGSGNIVSNITVQDCVVRNVCSDYQGGCGLFFGYVEGCTVEHNTLSDLPYSGITLGWGGWYPPTQSAAYCIGNQIIGNKIYNHMKDLVDGGGIYVNGAEQAGVISGNYIYNQGNLYGEIYLDKGSENWTVTSNVCVTAGGPSKWLSITYGDTNIYCANNFSDANNATINYNSSSNITVTSTTIVSNDNWPATAAAIMSAAGSPAAGNGLAASGTFINPAGGAWSALANWNGNEPANGRDQTADFSTLALNADVAVFLDDNYTLGNLIFGDTAMAHNWWVVSDSGTLTLAVSTNSPIITVNNETAFVDADLAGTNGLTKAGSGTLTLMGANTYTGLTTINAGTLKVTNAGTAMINSSGITGPGSVSYAAANVTFRGNVTTGGDQSYLATATGGLYSGGYVGAASIALTTTNGGSITLIGDYGNQNSIGHDLALDTSSGNGTINLDCTFGRAKHWYPLNSFSANAGTGAINWTGTNASNGSQREPITLTGAINFESSFFCTTAQTLTLNATAPSMAGGAFSGPMTLVKGGTSMLTLAGLNTFSGGLTITKGAIYAGNNQALGTGLVTIDNGGSGSYSQLFLKNGVTVSNSITIVNAASYYQGVLMVDAGSYGYGGANGSGGSGDTNGATFAGPITMNPGATSRGGQIAGPQNGTNWLTFTGPITNTVTGSVVIRNGRVRLAGGGNYTVLTVAAEITSLGANNGVCPNATLNLAVSAAATFDLNGYSQTLAGLANNASHTAVITNSESSPATLTLNLTASNNFSGVIAGDISLVQNGTTNLYLSGNNNYSGDTTVNGGTLEIAQPTLATNATVTVAGGAMLQLDFAATNQVGGLVLGGAAQSPGIYSSNTAPAYISGPGSLVIPSPVASYPTNITATVSGQTLTLSWPETHLGWIAQSNSVSLALTNSWFDIPGSQNGTNLVITMDPAQTSVFYRLRKP